MSVARDHTVRAADLVTILNRLPPVTEQPLARVFPVINGDKFSWGLVRLWSPGELNVAAKQFYPLMRMNYGDTLTVP